jgi:hypothetical protein
LLSLTKKSPAHAGLFLVDRCCQRPAPEPPVPDGPIVEPLGDGLIEVLPDGFSPLFCAAPALPAPPLMPLPVVVPVDEPVVVPGVVVAPGEVALPEAPPVLVVCAIASVLAKAKAAASPKVAFLMNYSLS